MVNLKKYHRCDDPVKSLLLLGWSPTDGAGGGVNTVSARRSFVNTSPGSALDTMRPMKGGRQVDNGCPKGSRLVNCNKKLMRQ